MGITELMGMQWFYPCRSAATSHLTNDEVQTISNHIPVYRKSTAPHVVGYKATVICCTVVKQVMLCRWLVFLQKQTLTYKQDE